jgi:hypothetical protein
MLRWILILVLAILVGCGAQAPRDSARDSNVAEFAEEFEQPQAVGDISGGEIVVPERKIIYEADVTVVVKDFAKIEKGVPELVKSHGGYLSEVEIDRAQGRYLTGRWVARIPVDRYNDFLDSLSSLGITERFNQTAQDVTEEYVDLEARIANKRRLEERILELLDKSEGAIKDIIEVERELARIRGEMEQMEGRKRYLENRTALTTVTIQGIERQDYVPPQAPTFSERIGLVWKSSLFALRRFGEGLTLCGVALAPWLVVLAIVIAPLAWLVRRRRRRRAAPPNE